MLYLPPNIFDDVETVQMLESLPGFSGFPVLFGVDNQDEISQLFDKWY